MDKYAERLSKWFGSSPFLMFHIVWFSIWIIAHFLLGFDEEWQILTIIVSLEAIFLALFILRGDNIQSERFEKEVKRDLKKSDEQMKLLKSIRNKQNK